jgi:N-acyl homoserine lactone hydrolase
MSVKKVLWLPAGHCLVDGSALDTRRPIGKMSNLPIWAYLIETTDGPILVDTGMPSSCVANPEGLFRGTEDEGMIVPQMSDEDVVTRILARFGYNVNDVACVVSTHWHFDHAGGNSLFPDTEIVVQEAEYQAAMTQDNYFDICKVPSLRYRMIDGDVELTPGLTLLHTPGHTPGHQSVLVRTETDGAVLLTIDAAYCRANYEGEVPFAVRSWADATRSIERLKDIAEDWHAKVFFGHDEEQARTWSRVFE